MKKNIITKILKEILEEENITSSGEVTSTPKIFNEAIPIKKSRRFVPNEFEFPENLLKPIGFGFAQEPKTYFKITTNSKGESILMIDPLVKTSLDSIERGRSSFSKEQNLSKLTQYLKERVPQEIRGLIKKYSSGKIIGNGFIPTSLIMNKNDNGWVMLNPSKENNTHTNINVKLYENQVEIDIPLDVEQAASRLATLLNNHFEFGKEDNTSDSVLNTILHNRNNNKWFEVAKASGKFTDARIPDILINWRKNAINTSTQMNEISLEQGKTYKFKNPTYNKQLPTGGKSLSSDKEWIDLIYNGEDEKGMAKFKHSNGIGSVTISKSNLNKDNIKLDEINESQIMKLVKQQLLKEASYGQFKKDVKFRSKNEMLHKGIKTVKSKLQEVDRIVEYMSRMKQELSENEESIQYWDKTKQSIDKIQEIVETLNNKIKSL